MIIFDPKPIQLFKIFKHLFKRCTQGRDCVSVRKCGCLLLSSQLFLVFILGHRGPPTTGRIQQLAYNTNHKQGATKLLTLLDKY